VHTPTPVGFQSSPYYGSSAPSNDSTSRGFLQASRQPHDLGSGPATPSPVSGPRRSHYRHAAYTSSAPSPVYAAGDQLSLPQFNSETSPTFRLEDPSQSAQWAWRAVYLPDDGSNPYPNVRPPGRTEREKIEDLYRIARDWKISYGQIVCLPLTGINFTGAGVSRQARKAYSWSQSISQSVAKFLRGNGTHRLSDFLAGVQRASAGLPKARDPERDLAFSLETPFQSIQHARPALAAYVAQTVRDELLRERHRASEPEAGLHAVAHRRAGSGRALFSWSTLTSKPLQHVRDILMDRMPLGFGLFACVGAPKPPKRQVNPERVVDARVRVEYAATRSLSTLLYSHNRRVKLLPVAEGILYFGHHVAQSLYDYGCRVSHVPSLKTIHSLLRSAGLQNIADLKERYQMCPYVVKATMDNVQHYERAWEERMWRSSKLIIGTAATSAEVAFTTPAAFCLDDKLKRVAEGQRKRLTVYTLKGLVDTTHRMTVYELHWVRTLVFSIPELAAYKPLVIKLFTDTPRSLRIPSDHRTRTQPVKSNGYNETVYAELLAAVLDILAQHGVTKESYHRILALLGGDGLTYEKLLALKNFLQHHPDDFDSLRILHPYLELWHLIWTDLSRICSTHWGDLTLGDPSTLAKSANQISRKAPPNFGKVDYYKYSDTVFLVLRARMLDCWRSVHLLARLIEAYHPPRLVFDAEDIFAYFQNKQAPLPSFPELQAKAKLLSMRYSSLRAHHYTMQGKQIDQYPRGPAWTPPTQQASSALGSHPENANIPARKSRRSARKAKPAAPVDPDVPFYGDRCLAQTIPFMIDAINNLELVSAVAECDPGRAWEATKVSILLQHMIRITHTRVAYHVHLCWLFSSTIRVLYAGDDSRPGARVEP
jgi:hypothetical protein